MPTGLVYKLWNCEVSQIWRPSKQNLHLMKCVGCSSKAQPLLGRWAFSISSLYFTFFEFHYGLKSKWWVFWGKLVFIILPHTNYHASLIPTKAIIHRFLVWHALWTAFTSPQPASSSKQSLTGQRVHFFSIATWGSQGIADSYLKWEFTHCTSTGIQR